MTDQYPKKAHVLVALDCIIFGFDQNELKLLLIKRGFEPEKGKWSLMGGFMGGDENLDAAAEKVLHQLTGLKKVYMEQFKSNGLMGSFITQMIYCCFHHLIMVKNEIRYI